MTHTSIDLHAAQTALDAHKQAFQTLLEMLIEANKTVNLTRIETPEQIRLRHFLDSLAALNVLDAAAGQTRGFSMIDVGSGAGFPALAIAIARPQWQVVSLEATDKKVQFQRKVCAALGLNNVRVLHGRAELCAHDPTLREQFDAVAARAVAGLDVLAELTLGFVRQGGLGVFWKGQQGQAEVDVAQAAAGQMGAAFTRLLDYRLPDESNSGAAMTLVVAEKVRKTPQDYPRSNFGVIKKRPLC